MNKVTKFFVLQGPLAEGPAQYTSKEGGSMTLCPDPCCYHKHLFYSTVPGTVPLRERADTRKKTHKAFYILWVLVQIRLKNSLSYTLI